MEREKTKQSIEGAKVASTFIEKMGEDLKVGLKNITIQNLPEPVVITLEEEKINELHAVNAEIYKMIQRLKKLAVDQTMVFQNLKDATINVQKAITKLLDAITDAKNQEPPAAATPA